MTASDPPNAVPSPLARHVFDLDRYPQKFVDRGPS